jgi:hypothetical protein
MLMDVIRRLREKWRWRRERIARLNAARNANPDPGKPTLGGGPGGVGGP